MNKVTAIVLIFLAIVLSSCKDEPLSCSNSAIKNMVVDQSRKLLSDQDASNPLANFGTMSRGELSLDEISTYKEVKDQSLCIAKLNVKLDPKILSSPYTDLKSNPKLEVHYAAQETSDQKEYRVTVTSLK